MDCKAMDDVIDFLLDHWGATRFFRGLSVLDLLLRCRHAHTQLLQLPRTWACSRCKLCALQPVSNYFLILILAHETASEHVASGL